MMPESIFLFATQRSGTNYLRSLLRNTGLIHDFAEIFNTTELNNEAMSHQYFLYRMERMKAEPGLSIPHEKNVRVLFQDYLIFLEHQAPTLPFYILDIKYSSLHHLDSFWQPIFAPNFIFKLLKEMDFKVIHLVRNNIFQLFISYKLAQKTKCYHHQIGKKNKLGKIRIDPISMLGELKRLESEAARVRRFLSPIKQKMEISYEELCTTPNNMPEDIGNKLSTFLGQNLTFQTEETYQKMIRDPFKVIRNKRSVRKCLEDSAFSKFIEAG